MLRGRRAVRRARAAPAAQAARWLLCTIVLVAALPPGARGDGADVSYPDCGIPLPAGQAFGIVGVNGGRPGTANPCLSRELAWALGSLESDLTFTPRVSFYVNTADPGPTYHGEPVAGWPHRGEGRAGRCRGGWSVACAYLYGEQNAARAFALAAAADPAAADTAPWWLDVERANSWAVWGLPSSAQLNGSAIAGFIAGLRSSRPFGPIGIYSTPGDWRLITGAAPPPGPSPFSAERNWIGAVPSRARAAADCGASLTGARAALSQYVLAPYDIDLSCP